jgi:type I restriction enzyme S subunit
LVGLSSVASETPAQRLIYPDLLIKLEVDRKQIMPRFLAYALRAPHSRMQIRKRSVGTSQSMVKISGARLKEVEVPVPSLVEQEGLIDRFDEVHGLSDRLQLEIESSGISLLRDSILHKAFAGEL